MSAQRHESSMMAALRSQFERQRQEAVGRLGTRDIGKSYTKKAWLADLVDWAANSETMRQAIQPIIYAALVEAGQAGMAEVGRQPSWFDPITPAIREYFQSRATKIAADVNAETEKQLRASLSQGAAAGEGTEQLRARVEAVMGMASTLRADRIARTEVSRAQGFANVEAWRQSGLVEAKEWFTARDDRVCKFCGPMDGRVVGISDNFFDKGDVMRVEGAKLDLSYDDVPNQPLHVNCRCVLLPVRTR